MTRLLEGKTAIVTGAETVTGAQQRKVRAIFARVDTSRADQNEGYLAQ